MTNDHHVKIIIPCTGEGNGLRVTVSSILKHTDYPSYEIVITANSDSKSDLSFHEGPADRRVTVLRTKKSCGSGERRNLATKSGDAAFYVFVGAHCLVEQADWLNLATEMLKRHPGAAMIQPEIAVFANDSGLTQGDEVAISKLRLLHYEYGAKWAWPYDRSGWLADPLTVKHVTDPLEVMSGGGVVITRADMFHQLGRFDPEVEGQFHETLDYCVRAWMLGYPTIVDTRIRIYHPEYPIHIGDPQTMFHLIHGRLRTAYKYLSPRRRDLAEILFRQQGYDKEVDQALEMVRNGQWLSERVEHLRNRIHNDNWLFSRFEVYEEQFSGQSVPAKNLAPAAGSK